MTDKYIFKLLERQNEVVLIIESDNLKFLTEINEDTFKLPYLKNKDLTKFLSKVIDKFQDKTLKLDYTVSKIDSNHLLLKILVWDGTKHTFDIHLKSKEIKDNENLEKKLNELKLEFKDELVNTARIYDDEIDHFKDEVDEKLVDMKKTLITKYATDTYRNYKFKSFKIIKCIHKVNRTFDIYEEIDKDKFLPASNDFFIKLYEELKKFEHFQNFTRNVYNESLTTENSRKIYHVKKYFMDVSIYNILEFILNNHGILDILHLNVDYNKATYKITLDISFIHDDSEYRVYKCYPSIYKLNIEKGKLIHHIINNKKDTLDIFIFQFLK